MPKPHQPEQPRRADALRNIEAILAAARTCLSRDSNASIGDIATAAGVGRVTLYGHFGSRAELVDAVVTETLASFDSALDGVDLTGDPRYALVRLVHAIWQLTAEAASLVVAAESTLSPERLLALHERPIKRLTDFIEHGQHVRAFRADLPAPWLVSVFHGIVHAAANEVASGRLAADEAGDLIAATLSATVETPARVPRRSRPTPEARQRR
jgi:TetR/AcrR family transcriptional repressor of mexCD-oprJ operon